MADPTRESAFLAEIAADPFNQNARMVYADWLEDAGDARCEIVRNHTSILLAKQFTDIEAELVAATNSLLAEQSNRSDSQSAMSDEWLQRIGFCRAPIELDGPLSAELNQQRLVMQFWAPWCGPCKVHSPIFHELATDLAGWATFVRINVDENTEVATAFNVSAIPQVTIRRAGVDVGQQIGLTDRDALFKKIVNALNE